MTCCRAPARPVPPLDQCTCRTAGAWDCSSLNARIVGTSSRRDTQAWCCWRLFWGIAARHSSRAASASRMRRGKPGQGAQARTLVPLLGNILRVTLAISRAGRAGAVRLSRRHVAGRPRHRRYCGGAGRAEDGRAPVRLGLAWRPTMRFALATGCAPARAKATVERIGLRSTSFRTIERTVVRIPNGRLADERIETFGERDRMLLKHRYRPHDYDTGAASWSSIRDDIEAALRAPAKIWPDAVRVHVVAFTDRPSVVTVLAWFETSRTGTSSCMIRHRCCSSSCASWSATDPASRFPSRTVYHVTQPAVRGRCGGRAIAGAARSSTRPARCDGVDVRGAARRTCSRR